MRGVVFVVLVLLMAPSPSYALSSPSHPSDIPLPASVQSMKKSDIVIATMIKFILVCPGKPVESFVIANLGPVEVDLLGLKVSDGEGNLTFAVETILRPGEVIALTTDEVGIRPFHARNQGDAIFFAHKTRLFRSSQPWRFAPNDGSQRLPAGQFRLWGFHRSHRMVRGSLSPHCQRGMRQ